MEGGGGVGKERNRRTERDERREGEEAGDKGKREVVSTRLFKGAFATS